VKKLRHDHDDMAGDRHSGEPWSVVASQARQYWNQASNGLNRPWWMYSAHRCCEGLSDLVFLFDDPIWRSLYPPNSRHCMCGVLALRAVDVEKGRFDDPAIYDGREALVVGRDFAENRGYRLHRLSSERRPVEAQSGWLGRPVACEPAEVYRGSGFSFKGGGMIVPPDVSLPDADPGDRSLPLATRRLATLRLDVLTGLAAILLSDGPEVAAPRSPPAILWAKVWDVDVADGEALALQLRAAGVRSVR